MRVGGFPRRKDGFFQASQVEGVDVFLDLMVFLVHVCDILRSFRPQLGTHHLSDSILYVDLRLQDQF